MPRKGNQRTRNKRSGQRSRQTTVFQTVYKTGKEAARGMSVVALISLVFLMLTSVFLLYQWKEFRILQVRRQISALDRALGQLETEINHKETQIRQLIDIHRISRIARQHANLQQSIEETGVLPVDAKKWQYFREKDASSQHH